MSPLAIWSALCLTAAGTYLDGCSSVSLPGISWPSLHGLSRLVIFGDSYTTIGFNVSGPQPTVDNVLGNPPYPGYTSSNGPNWVDYLTVQYNQSVLQTLDLAYGGATVDGNLVAAYLPTVLSVKQQVQDEFLPIYGQQNNAKFPWQAKTTLFAVFIGINDVGNSYGNPDRDEIYPKIFSEYAGLLSQLYGAGARNFLFINVPPVNRSPLTVSAGSAAQAAEKSTIAAWNHKVTTLATSLKNQHKETSVFVYDANTLFNAVLDDPRHFPETAAYKNTTDYCVAYENGTPTSYSFNATCGIPVDEYFWLNSLHPTFRMQQLLAKEIAQQLSSHGFS